MSAIQSGGVLTTQFDVLITQFGGVWLKLPNQRSLSLRQAILQCTIEYCRPQNKQPDSHCSQNKQTATHRRPQNRNHWNIWRPHTQAPNYPYTLVNCRPHPPTHPPTHPCIHSWPQTQSSTKQRFTSTTPMPWHCIKMSDLQLWRLHQRHKL